MAGMKGIMTMSEIVEAKKSKMDSIQALRALAFAGVFIGHFFVRGWSHFAVSTFFVLSAFLLALKSPEDSGKCSFAEAVKTSVRRMSKLYPLHIITMIMAIPYFFITEGIANAGNAVKLIKQIVLNVLLITSLYPDAEMASSLNRVAWFLSSIFFLYIIFPFIYRVLNRIKGIFSHLLIITVSIATQTLVVYLIFGRIFDMDLLVYLTHISPAYRLFDFVCGISLGIIAKRLPENAMSGKAGNTVAEIILFSIFAYLVYLSDSGVTWIYLYRAPFCPLVGVAFTMIFYRKKGVLTKLLTNRLTVFIGNMSGYAYLIHFPLIVYANHYIIDGLTRLRRTIIFGGVLPSVVAITFISSYLYDRYYVKRKK